MEGLYACKDHENVPIRFENLIINKVSSDMFQISGTIHINETLEDPTNVSLNYLKFYHNILNKIFKIINGTRLYFDIILKNLKDYYILLIEPQLFKILFTSD